MIEKKVNNLLRGFPVVKKAVKRIYQIIFTLTSRKPKLSNNIVKITPDDGFEYFFGYYDKSPWCANDRFVLCLRVKEAHKKPAYDTVAEIIMIDTQKNNEVIILGKTNAWNVQQGCMLQWLGPNFDEEIIYNDYYRNDYSSVILNIKTKEKRIIKKPVYSVTKDGNFALTLDFSRLHRLRPGYGYINKKDFTKDDNVPNSTAIWLIDIKKDTIESVLEYTDLFNFERKDNMEGAEHKVNHLMINENGSRAIFLHRWIKNNNRFTRLVSMNLDGSDLYNLSDDDMTSHCNWKTEDEIVAYLNKKEYGTGYYLLKDKTNKYDKIIEDLKVDGHPSYSSDKQTIITDTYPNKKRVSKFIVANENEVLEKYNFYNPFKYDNDTRCDLHPRWNRENSKVCVDSVHDGKRALYIIEIGD